MKETKAEKLTVMAEVVIIRLGLSMDNLRFQTYDGASNMSGTYKGSQALVKEKQPLALYIHCGAHVTHLFASCAANSVPLIRDSLQIVQDLGNVCNASADVRNILAETSSIDIASGEKVGRIKPLCPTRWLSRCTSVTSVLNQYSHVLPALETVSKSVSGETASRARGLL